MGKVENGSGDRRNGHRENESLPRYGVVYRAQFGPLMVDQPGAWQKLSMLTIPIIPISPNGNGVNGHSEKKGKKKKKKKAKK